MRSKDLEKILDRVLEAVIFSEGATLGMGRDKLDGLPISTFDEMDILDGDMGGERIFFLDATPDVIWPIDQSVACWKAEHLELIRMLTVSPKDLRGLASVVPRHAAMLYSSHIESDGKRWAEGRPVGFMGGKWVPIDGRVTRTTRVFGDGSFNIARRAQTARLRKETKDTCAMVMGIAFTNRYEWSVSFRIDTSPSLRFFTDPTGIRALFKDRAKGNRDRRSALKHWVIQHWREHRNDPAADIFVREHLRGAEAFQWCGYDCRVNVSPFDLELAEAAKARRAAMGSRAHPGTPATVP